MRKHLLLENSVANQARIDTERAYGSIDVYEVLLEPGEIGSTWSEFKPGKHLAEHVCTSEGISGLLITDPMDDYCRPYFLQESDLKNKPVYLKSISPEKDKAEIQSERVRLNEEQVQKRQAEYASRIYDKAERINLALGPVFHLPDNKEEFVNPVDHTGAQIPSLGAMIESIHDSVDRFLDRHGDLSAVDVDLTGQTYVDLLRVRKALRTKSFELDHDIKLTSEYDSSNNVVSIFSGLSDGSVIEKIHIPVEDCLSEIDGEQVRLSRLAVDSHDVQYVRFDRQIEYEESMLALLADEFEDMYFDFSDNPTFSECTCDDGTSVESMSQLEAPYIYDFIAEESPSLIGKLSMASKAYRRQLRHTHESQENTMQH